LSLLLAAAFAVSSGFAAFPQFSGLDLATGHNTAVAVPAGAKALAVVFLSAKCPCSRSHEPVLADLARRHPGIAFAGVHSNQDEALSAARTHFAEAGLPFPVLQDERDAWADRYGALKTPHLFLISPSGEILYRGGVDDSRHAERASQHYLADALDAVEAGRRPAVTESRALGCVIRR
jgi:hypothetical protein